MNKTKLILDLDGVLITTPTWKADEIDNDGYSKFNSSCVTNLNKLLDSKDFEIWLSSTRRTRKSLEEFNQIFSIRNIKGEIFGFLPECPDCRSRKEEIERFINKNNLKDYLIIDDDKSLNDLDSFSKKQLVLTRLTSGLDDDKLNEAILKIKTAPNKG